MRSSIFGLAVFFMTWYIKKNRPAGCGTKDQAMMKLKLFSVNLIFLSVSVDGIGFFHYLSQAYIYRQEYLPAAVRQRRHLFPY